MFDLTLPDIFAKIVILLIAFPIHEFAHALAAYRLGDDTAARHGRLTLRIRRWCHPWFNEFGGYGEVQWASQEAVQEAVDGVTMSEKTDEGGQR